MPAPLILAFKHLDSYYSDQVDSRFLQLAMLSKEGISVANGFVLTPSAYDLFIDSNNIRGKMSDLQRSLTWPHPDSVQTAILSHKTEIKKATFSDSFSQLVQMHLGWLSLKPDDKLIIRAGNLSFLLDKTDHSQVLAAIRHVWSEQISESTIFSRGLHNRHSLLIQALPNYLHEGKVYTKNFLSPIKIELTNGTDPYTTLSNNALSKLSEQARKLINILYFPQEFTFVANGDDVHIISVRETQPNIESSQSPVVDSIVQDEVAIKPAPEKGVTLSGRVLKGGLRTGRAINIRTKHGWNKKIPSAEEIAIFHEAVALPDYHMRAAVVKKTVPESSHVKRRHIHGPVIDSVGEVVNSIRNGQIITVNGLTGEVYLGSVR